MTFFVLIVLLSLYFLPSIVAVLRKAPDTGSVIVLNLLLGWTFVGWVVALAMAARTGSSSSINVSVHQQQPGSVYGEVTYGHPQQARPQPYPAVGASYGGHLGAPAPTAHIPAAGQPQPAQVVVPAQATGGPARNGHGPAVPNPA
jgi:hypothetical protein